MRLRSTVRPLALLTGALLLGTGLAALDGPLTGTAAAAHAADAPVAGGRVVGWGYDEDGRTSAPEDLTDAVSIAAGQYYGVAARSDGTVAVWGDNLEGDPLPADDLRGVAAVSPDLALLEDGTVAPLFPPEDRYTEPPAGLSGVTAIDSSGTHSVALRDDGTVAIWGYDQGRVLEAPPGLDDVVAISAASFHTLAVTSDGSVVSWGYDGPDDIFAGYSDIVAVAAGRTHDLAVRADGSVVAEGSDRDGESDVPAGLTGVVAVAAGYGHSVALREDGTVAAWGDDGAGQSTVPAGLKGVTSIDAGYGFTLATGTRPVLTAAAPPTATVGTPFSFAFGGDARLADHTLASGTLPPGLTLTPEGFVTGTPAEPGTSDFTVTATNSFGTTTIASRRITVEAAPPAPVAPTISGTVAAGVVGSDYEFTYAVAGTPAPVVTVSSGALPPGLTLDPTGRLTGTPTRTGAYVFTVQAASTAGTATAQSTLTVSPASATAKADLRVDVSAPTTAVKGRTFTYTLITKNAGPSTSTSVYSKVILPPGVRFVSATGKYTRIGSVVVFQRSSLGNGRTSTEKITVTAVSAGTGTALATTFSVRTPDPSIRSNADTAATTVR
ncbi:putative Ig domain-containing protein [Rathayibacter sp. AY1E6]|uniref:putative Ig domain-containing protein n=1 Tax=Rathayibacter sp. AY1E6 TaxID=2080554 RepID=UPI000CE784F1|nr:putative Ig domain-containing protein [Rathayibacter sp. AY1E6]PPF71898.1 hypothetical protein C5C46_08110 [Rathayibacter sp. AY1E6]